jgi:hypothetical protein
MYVAKQGNFFIFKYLNNVFQNSEIDFIVSVLTFMKQTGLKAAVLLWLYIKATIHTSWMQKNQTFLSHLWPGIFKIQFFNQKFEFYCMDKGRSPEFL